MNTPTHFLLHTCIRKFFKEKKQFNIPKSFLLGSVTPDILLFVLVLFYIPLSVFIYDNSLGYTFSRMFDTLYFEHPLWIFSYNIFHAPTCLLIMFTFLLIFKKKLGDGYITIKWFLIGCFLHTVFDIPLHHDDGPRIFYPFSSYSFSSPVSYWDVNHYGRIVSIIELIVIIAFLIYMFQETLSKAKIRK